MQISINTKNFEKYIQESLSGLSDTAVKRATAKAINKTAEDTRKLLMQKAQETYRIKNAGWKKAVTIKKANYSDPAATLHWTGEKLELYKFTVNPAKIAYTPNQPEFRKAAVLKKEKLKPMLGGASKAFVVTFSSGHTTLVEREGTKRLPLKGLYAQSIPEMIGNEKHVYAEVRPKMQKILMENSKKQIQEEIRRAAVKK